MYPVASSYFKYTKSKHEQASGQSRQNQVDEPDACGYRIDAHCIITHHTEQQNAVFPSEPKLQQSDRWPDGEPEEQNRYKPETFPPSNFNMHYLEQQIILNDEYNVPAYW